MDAGDVLATLPDLGGGASVEAFAQGAADTVHQAVFTPADRAFFAGIAGHELPNPRINLPRFISGALAADWLSYEAPADRASLERLEAVIRVFPRGFRLWFCRAENGQTLPVGYTGWYPISREAFAKACYAPETLTDRRELWPLPTLAPDGSPIWLFNYSIAGQLRRSAASRRMLQRYAADLANIRTRGLAAAILSVESIRVAERFGMSYRGDMQHEGVSEKVYAQTA